MSCSRMKSALRGALGDSVAAAWLVFPFIIVLALWITAYPLMMNWHQGNIERAGQTGDMFGVYNTLFTGLALVGLIYTIKLQRDELREAKLDAEAQRKHIEHQQFDSTFFQLMEMRERVLDAVETDHDGIRVTGRVAIAVASDQALDTVVNNEEVHESREYQEEVLSNFFRDQDVRYGQYFRVSYRILRLIDIAERSGLDVSFHAKTYRALLSMNELVFLMINALTTHGKGMKPLIEKYGVLKHLDKLGGVKASMSGFFSPTAFKDSEEVVEG